MHIEATVVLDSGCFLPAEKPEGLEPGHYYSRIGYFQNPTDEPDARIFVDSNEIVYEPGLKLRGEKGSVEVRHVYEDGTANSEGATRAKTFHEHIVHLKHLYGEHIEMSPDNFDYIITFRSGRFLPSMVKKRAFKESTKEKGAFLFAPTGNRKEIHRVAHNVLVHFTIRKGETLELVRDNEVILSSRDLGAKNRIEIELPVSNVIGNKFYHDGFKDPRTDDLYWLPNECDPPPNCPRPPCGDDPLGC